MNKYTTAAAASAVALMSVFAGANDAQARITIDPRTCGNKDAIVQKLVTEYGETLQTQRQHRMGLIETFANEENGSWSDLITNPSNQNLACIFASGGEFKDLDGIVPEYTPEEAPEPEVEEPKFDL